MMQFFGAHFGGLLNFSGREARQPFWLWVAFNMALQMVMAVAVFVPFIVQGFAKMEQFAAEHPDQVTRTYGPGSYTITVHGSHPELMPDLSGVLVPFEVGALITVLLLSAAVARRLHDTDRTGAWGLLPLPFLTAGLVMMQGQFGAFAAGTEPDINVFLMLFANNMVYLALLGLLVFLCVQPGTPGENRFGPPCA